MRTPQPHSHAVSHSQCSPHPTVLPMLGLSESHRLCRWKAAQLQPDHRAAVRAWRKLQGQPANVASAHHPLHADARRLCIRHELQPHRGRLPARHPPRPRPCHSGETVLPSRVFVTRGQTSHQPGLLLSCHAALHVVRGCAFFRFW